MTNRTKEDVAFDLTYFGGFDTWSIRAYMLRHGPDWRCGETADDFTVNRMDNDEVLGWGETKEDAISVARCSLAHVAEQQAFEAGRIDRPYGKRIFNAGRPS